MSAIAFFALACSVFLLVSFVYEVIKVSQEIYRGRSLETHIKDSAEILGSLAVNYGNTVKHSIRVPVMEARGGYVMSHANTQRATPDFQHQMRRDISTLQDT
jgi:hypothetical protein